MRKISTLKQTLPIIFAGTLCFAALCASATAGELGARMAKIVGTGNNALIQQFAFPQVMAEFTLSLYFQQLSGFSLH